MPGTCTEHAECSDGKVCNGEETCSATFVCEAGTPVACGAHEHCEEPSGACVCDDGYVLVGGVCEPSPCSVPRAPVLTVIHGGAELTWSAPGSPSLEIGTSQDPGATQPDAWTDGSSLVLPSTGLPQSIRAFARVKDPSCVAADPFMFSYEVREHYPPAAGEPNTLAVALDDPGIVGWATDWVDPVDYGTDLDDQWKHPERAVGPAQGTSMGIVSLGRGGSIVLSFDPPIVDGPGPDFAVFETGFSDTFLELGFVEVSSNGTDFVRFDGAYLGLSAVGPYGGHDTKWIGALAGKYRQGFGTPFDLAVLVNREEVRSAEVDTSQIRYVRIVDIVGDGSTPDSFGNTIWDPYPTSDSAGFDLDGVAVLND